MKDIVNIKIKFREPFRPFAPSVIQEECEKYFDIFQDIALASKSVDASFELKKSPKTNQVKNIE